MSINVIHDLETIWTGDSAVTFSPDTMAVVSGFQRTGTGNFALQVSNELIETWATVTSFSLLGRAMYMWMISYGQLATYINGGIGIVLGDGTNTIAFYTGGKDRFPFLSGGWQCHVIDPAKIPPYYNVIAGSVGSLNFGAITQVGVRYYTLAKSLGGAVNCFTDTCRVGTGLTLQGGTSAAPATFFSAALEDEGTGVDQGYGIIRQIQPGIYGVQGRLDIGDTGSNNSWFEDEDSLVVWEDWGQSDSLYSTTIHGGTGTNVVQFGQKIGSGDTALGSNGCTFQSSGPQVRFSWTGSDIYLTGSSYLNIYGTKFFKLRSNEYIQFNRSGSDFIGNIVDQCSQVVIGQTFARNCTFSGVESHLTSSAVSATSASLLWSGSVNIKYSAFNNNTVIGTNPPNVNAGIEIPSEFGPVGVTFDNLSFSGNDFDVLSQYTGSLTLSATDSNVSSYTSSVSGTVDIINNVFITVNVEDTSGIAIESASVWIATDDVAQTVLMNEYTTNLGIAVENYNYLSDQDIVVRVRKSSPGDTRYNNISTVGLIDEDGFTTTIVMSVDTNVSGSGG
jgi:hypothetical protein